MPWSSGRRVSCRTGTSRAGGHRRPRRVVELVGELPSGSELERQGDVFALYDAPFPDGMRSSGQPMARAWAEVEVDRGAALWRADGATVLRITDSLGKGALQFGQFPIALTPARGPLTTSIREALREVADAVARGLAGVVPGTPEAASALPAPVRDLLMRRPPRLVAGRVLPPAVDGDFVAAIRTAVLALDGSTLWVQSRRAPGIPTWART